MTSHTCYLRGMILKKKTRDVLYVWCYISIIHFESILYDDMIVSTDCATAISQPPGNSAISSCFIWPKLDVFQQSFPFHLEIVSSTLVKTITGMNVIHDVNFTLIAPENRSKLTPKKEGSLPTINFQVHSTYVSFTGKGVYLHLAASVSRSLVETS